ncbi:hypothetical protein [Natranaerofaba carboxydovora]|uniref:hypothetical protein n=1 Tax=Natranaerofaba carboxydovora TaxID=2742683 RepID=UPI001F13B61F|nr:hypothetical protein [Natranaerofaba carboxydovora]UMZ73545.1 hypothetical protein ACONDI_01099 [Natranaerofaba carboxydovora]
MKIKLPITYDWPYLMGITGLIRLLEESVEFVNQFEVEIDINELETLADKYFDFVYNQCDFLNPFREILKKYQIEPKDFEAINNLKSRIKDAKKFTNPKDNALKELNEITSMKKDIYDNSGQLIVNEEKLDEFTTIFKERLNNLFDHIAEKELLKDEVSIVEQLILTNIRGKYLKPIMAQSGILNPAVGATSQNTKSHKDWLHKNLVQKAIDEIVDPPNSLNKCFFIPSLPGTNKFINNTFFQLGISEKEAKNYQWNYQSDSLPRVSTMALLIMLLIPVGVAHYNKEYNYTELEKQRQDIRPTWSFIITDEPFEEMYKTNMKYIKEKELNNQLSNHVLKETILDVSRRGLKNNIRTRAKKEKNFSNQITIVEVWANPDNQRKESDIETLTLPDYVVDFFGNVDNVSKIEKIPFKYTDRITSKIMKGIDFQPIIYELLNAKVKGEFYGSTKNVCIARLIFRQLKKGEKQLDKKTKGNFDHIYIEAQKLRTKLSNIWDERKLNGIVYRLLNTAKTKNRRAFMDIVFRLHIAAEMQISKSIANASIADDDSDISFDDIANAFISGLLSKENIETARTK